MKYCPEGGVNGSVFFYFWLKVEKNFAALRAPKIAQKNFRPSGGKLTLKHHPYSSNCILWHYNAVDGDKGARSAKILLFYDVFYDFFKVSQQFFRSHSREFVFHIENVSLFSKVFEISPKVEKFFSTLKFFLHPEDFKFSPRVEK